MAIKPTSDDIKETKLEQKNSLASAFGLTVKQVESALSSETPEPLKAKVSWNIYGEITKVVLMSDPSIEPIIKITDDISCLHKLGQLYLIKTGLSYISSEISSLDKLWKIVINDRSRTMIPELEGETEKNYFLKELPEEFGDLKSLRELTILSSLTEVPESIGDLQKLQHLYLCSNQLTYLPEEIGNLESLELMVLFGNQLTTLPESIGELKSLLILSAQDNELGSLPESIGGLNALEMLLLGKNKLSDLPSSICNLKNLRVLALNDNKIRELPNCLYNLDKIKIIDLRKNYLEFVPQELSYLEPNKDPRDDIYSFNYIKEMSSKGFLSIPIFSSLSPLITTTLLIDDNPFDNRFKQGLRRDLSKEMIIKLYNLGLISNYTQRPRMISNMMSLTNIAQQPFVLSETDYQTIKTLTKIQEKGINVDVVDDYKKILADVGY